MTDKSCFASACVNDVRKQTESQESGKFSIFASTIVIVSIICVSSLVFVSSPNRFNVIGSSKKDITL